MATDPTTASSQFGDPRILTRVLAEGYGPGAWHGADLRAALADTAPGDAFWRPGVDRHNIAEMALHHAWQLRAVLARISDRDPTPFPLDGDDWFELSDDGPLVWAEIQSTLDAQHRQLAAVVADLERGSMVSPLPPDERLSLVLGVTCHAVYHAGQVQLVKALIATRHGETAATAAPPASAARAVYYVGSYDIDDPVAFARYGPAVMALLPKYGAELLASDREAYAVEGRARAMNAIIRFPSREAALGLYNDPEYQEAKRIRQQTTSNGDMLLVAEVGSRGPRVDC